MKIAITSAGNSIKELVDKRFARCNYFTIYDTENKSMEIIPNINKEEIDKVGFHAVDLLVSKKVEKIISGNFGEKAKSSLDSNKIQMIVIKGEKTIEQVIQLIDNN